MKHDVAMKILLTADQRRMVEWLARNQRRSMNDVVRLALERVYQAEQRRIAEAGGMASGFGVAHARSV